MYFTKPPFRHPGYFKFKRKYQQSGTCFQTVFPFFMTMIYLCKTYCMHKTSDAQQVYFNTCLEEYNCIKFCGLMIDRMTKEIMSLTHTTHFIEEKKTTLTSEQLPYRITSDDCFRFQREIVIHNPYG